MTIDSIDFFGQRLRSLRFVAGLSQSELAERAGLAASMISRLEQDSRVPSTQVLELLCSALDVNQQFFSAKLHYEAAFEDVHFRHRVRMPAKQRNYALGHATFAVELVEFFEANLRLPTVRLPPPPPVVTVSSIEQAAERARGCISLPNDRPLASPVRTIESAGIPVILSPDTSDCVDAFSVHRQPRPVVILNRKDSGSRVNLTGAHELGHLILHQGRETGDRETESEADRFASAFLMPARAFAQEFPRSRKGMIDWAELRKMKSRWRVSMQAMIRRAFDLEIISDVTYRRACQYASAQGWRRAEPGEPDEFAADSPTFLASCFEIAERARGVSPMSIAQRLSWPLELLRRVACVPESDARFSAQRKEEPCRDSNVIFAFKR